MDTGNEKIVKHCSGLEEIRAAAKNSVGFKQNLLKSIDAIIQPLESIFESLILKGNCFRPLHHLPLILCAILAKRFLILTQPLVLKK